MFLHFDAVGLEDPATAGFDAAFRTYVTSSTIFHWPVLVSCNVN